MPGERQWSRETARLLRGNGFNYANFGAFTLKHYSDVMAAGCGERILDSGGRKLAYIDLAYMLRSFVWNTEIDRLKLNRLIAVFHPDYLDHLSGTPARTAPGSATTNTASATTSTMNWDLSDGASILPTRRSCCVIFWA